MVKRLLLEKLRKSPKSILLVGPRQVGKSTLLKLLKPEKIINLSNEAEFIKISSELEMFESLVKDKKTSEFRAY